MEEEAEPSPAKNGSSLVAKISLCASIVAIALSTVSLASNDPGMSREERIDLGCSNTAFAYWSFLAMAEDDRSVYSDQIFSRFEANARLLKDTSLESESQSVLSTLQGEDGDIAYIAIQVLLHACDKETK